MKKWIGVAEKESKRAKKLLGERNDNVMSLGKKGKSL